MVRDFLLWWFLSAWLFGAVSASQWYVSRLNGTDEVDCGREKSRPCKHIYRATAHAHHGDVINIDGSGTSRDPYPCDVVPGLPTQYMAGVSLGSYKTQAFVACRNNSLQFTCDFASDFRNGSSSDVFLAGITFVNTSLCLVDCSLKMSGVKFVNSSIDALSLNFSRSSAGNVDISGCTFYNNSGTGLKIRGDSVNLNITDTFFTENKLRMHRSESALLIISPQSLSAQIQVNFNVISVSKNNCSGKACMKIRSGGNGIITMLMKFGSFENNYARESVVDIRGTSVINFTENHFTQNVGRAINIRDGNSVQLKITRSMFFENKMVNSIRDKDGGALCVRGFTRKALVSMSRSHFRSNAGANGGACAFIDLSSLEVDIKKCRFNQNEGSGSSGGALAIGTMDHALNNTTINIHDSNFTGNKIYNANPHFSIGGGGAAAFYVVHVWGLTLTNNSFVKNTAEQKVAGAIYAMVLGTLHHDVLFINCEFIGNSGAVETGTLHLVLLTSSPPRVRIQSTKFIQNKAIFLAQYIILVRCQGFLKIDSCTIQHNSGGGVFFPGASDVSLENSVISDNDNFMFSLNGIKNASFKLTNVSMLRNNCREKSNIFHVSMNQAQNSLRFQASSFVDNFCMSGVVEISVTPRTGLNNRVISSGTVVAINNTVFHGNSGVAKSALTIVNADVVHIENCSYKNNFGAHGSHLTVQLRSSRLTIFKTNFYQSEKSNVFNTSKEQPYNGFLKVTSFGNISIEESSFISDPLSYDGMGLIYVEGAEKVNIDHSVKIQSPIGSKLILQNFSHWETITTRKWVTWFSFITRPCSTSTYSIKRGSSMGLKMDYNVKCLPCPNGGNCTKDLAARPNFWGYPVGDTVRFQLCPHGYCCPAVNQKCPYHNESYQYSGCQGNRSGILCGRCKKNFSEALFRTNCAPVEECTHRWYLVVFFICAMLFAFYLIRKPPVFQKVMKMSTWFIQSYSRKGYRDVDKLETEHKAIPTSSSLSSHGYLKILFYFYQVAGLLIVPSYGVGELLTDKIVFPITSLFDFRLYPHSDWNICPFAGLTPLTKTLTQVFVVMAIFLAILIIYLLHSGLNKLRKRTPVFPSGGPYLAAILESVLLGYSAVTGTTTRLLYCVKIPHVHRWYYSAEITCYQWWQKASIAGIILYIFPFIFILYFGSLRLHRRQTSAKTFLLACVFPLPYLFYVCAVYLQKALTRSLVSRELTSKSSAVDLEEGSKTSSQCTLEALILEVLSAPFSRQNQDDQSPGKIYWESVLIGRRFILIMIGWFMTPQTFLRSVCLTMTCLIFLLHHLHTKPFVKHYANLAETVSMTTLVAIAILNVAVASYYSTGTEYHNLQKRHVDCCVWAEAILLGFIPLVLVIFLFLSLMSQLVRLTMVLIKLIRWLSTRSKSANHEEGQPLLNPFTSKVNDGVS